MPWMTTRKFCLNDILIKLLNQTVVYLGFASPDQGSVAQNEPYSAVQVVCLLQADKTG